MKSLAQQKREGVWQAQFDRLPAYRQPDGTIYVPMSGPGSNPNLWTWCAYQRRLYLMGRISPERVARMEGAGFLWRLPKRPRGGSYGAKSTAKWDRLFQRLLARKEQHGFWRAPASNAAGHRRLDNWVRAQRSKRRRGILQADRVARLTAAGFPWSSQYSSDVWEARVATLVKFKKKHRHARPTLTMPGMKKLAKERKPTTRGGH